MTASGLSKKWFYHEFYEKKKYPIFTLTPEQDAFIRDQSYLGGRVELFRLGQIGEKVYYLDFTSLYPSQMVNDLPYGEPYEAKFEEDVLPEQFFGFVRCMVQSTESGMKRLPLHGEKLNGKLQFRHLTQPREMVLFTEEILLGMKEGLYTYKFKDGLGFKRGKHLKPMVEKLFKMKADAKKNGQDALASVLKIVLNSLYGFWGTRIKDREGLEIYQSDGDVPFFDRLNKQQLVGLTEHERYTVLRVEKDLPIDDINVSIAAATTSYSRNQIWKLMDAIKQRGSEVFMCDTDSVITNCDVSKHIDLLDQFIPDWQSDDPGAALGSLKCECTDDVKKALKSKYAKDESEILMNEMRGGDSTNLVSWRPIPFDDCILSALKTYALRKVLPTGTIFTFKHKGVSKAFSSGLTPEQEEQMWNRYLKMHSKNQPLSEGHKNLQFRCGLSSYMSENLTPLLKFEVSKNVTAKYDKGVVSEDYVNECKTISTLNNDNDQQNMCSSAPSCSLVLHKPYESHDHYRIENAVESFPSDFGCKSNDRPGPVAGLSFMEVEEDKSLTWYRDTVKGSFSKDRLTIKNSQWKDLAMYLDEDIYKKNQYKISKKGLGQPLKKKMVNKQNIKTIILEILRDFDFDVHSMKDVCAQVKMRGISWSKNKNIIKPFVLDYVAKSNIEKHEFSLASSVFNKNLLTGSSGPIISLEEPINMDKLNETIEFIKSRQHILHPVGKDRKHDKVREVLTFLEEMAKQPKVKEYYYSHGIGRLYVKGGSSTVRSKSMQGCFKGLRAALIGHVGHDIDIENSLPSLTVQWLDKLVELGKADLSSEDFALLKEYVNNRSSWLNNIQEFHKCDRDSAKNLVLVTMFGGDPKWHLKKHATLNTDRTFPRLQQLVEELASVRRKVVTFQNQLPKYRKLYDRKLKEKGSEEAALRSAFSIYTQEIEDCVMEKIREYIWSQGIDIFSLIHDGLIISACSDELLRGAEDHIAQCGWHIRLVEKPLHGLQDQPIPELSPLY